MFTGIVQRTGVFDGFRVEGGGASLSIRVRFPDGDPLSLGESVAVQGCCLTVSAVSPDGFSADVLNETLARTALSSLTPGSRVNLERAMRAGDRFGGHIVQGHVDAVARLVSVSPAGRDFRLRFECGADAFRYVVYKGSVALDGVSLTVSAICGEGEFEVNVIPTTWRLTSLSDRGPGDGVNLETDVIGRYVERFLGAPGGRRPIDETFLRDAGFGV